MCVFSVCVCYLENSGSASARLVNIALLSGLLLVRLVDCIVSLSDFYSYRLIGKLTAFLQLQEFSQRNPTVPSGTFAARLSLDCSNQELDILSLRPQLCV